MAPTTRSGVRGASRSADSPLPRKRKMSASSASSTSETERAPALPRKRSLRRLMTIELPAAELRAMDRARQEETAKPTPSLPSAPSPPPTTPPHDSSPPPSATPRPWGFGSFFTNVRRILSPFPPSRRELAPITEESPKRVESRPAPSLPPPASTPEPPIMSRKRRSSDDNTSTPKRVKYSARRTAKIVREQREAIAESTASPTKFTSAPLTSSSPSKPLTPAVVESTASHSARTHRQTSPTHPVSHPPAATMESTMGPGAEASTGKKRKRVKIDDLKHIPSRRPGQSTGTFALLDEFFVEDEDSVEVDESQLELLSERPSKRTRTENNVFDLTSPQKQVSQSRSPKKRDRSISPTKRSRHRSPEKSSFLSTPSALADKIPTPARVQFAVPEDDSDEELPTTPNNAATSHHFNDAFTTPDSARMQSVKKTTPQAAGSPIDLDGPQHYQGSPMDASASHKQANFGFAEVSNDNVSSPQGPEQHIESLQRKRSEAEKYKPTKGSRLKEMQRLSSTSTLLESPQHEFIVDDSTSPTDAPPEYLFSNSAATITPTISPPTLAFNAPAATPLTSGSISFTPRDTPQEGTLYTAPATSPIISKQTSSTPAGSAPRSQSSSLSGFSSTTPTTTPPTEALFPPQVANRAGTAAADMPSTPPSRKSFTPSGVAPSKAVFTPPALTSYTPATVSFTPLDSPPADLLTFPSSSPLSADIPIDSLPQLPDTEETEQQIEAAARAFSVGVGSFFHPLAVA
ncbi:hypothetical protein BDZ85DRAFT_300074 [Elsinoe ampelina]|uniref:Uncharacterized protein n=1 Tax=Elsinoe ampelina TaxID=302913 RepID=A0A6A6GPH0_9PEZI|nr:hypothetical protein BDZ85DRAFT_300074 [Elsinoe ampelina]